MDDISSSTMKIVEEIDDLFRADESRDYYYEVEDNIKSMQHELTLRAEAIEKLIYYTKDEGAIETKGRETIKYAIQCKEAIESYIAMRRVQERRGRWTRLVFCLNDHMDRKICADDLSLLAGSLRHADPISVALHRQMEIEMGRQPLYASDHKIVGREKDINSIKKKLMGSNDDGSSSRIFFVLGSRGIGKTTVARKVFQHHTVRAYFNCFAWISNGSETETTTEILLKRILNQLTKGLQIEETSLDTVDDSVSATTSNNVDILKRQLHSFLKDKRYLIVIDNFTKMTEAWYEILSTSSAPGRPTTTPYGLDGSRIMLISAVDVIEKEPRYPYHKLEPLNEEQSWKLYNFEVRREVMYFPPPELYLIARQLVRNCHGEPRNIVELASLLSRVDTTYNVWRGILNNNIGNRRLSSGVQEEISLLPLNLQACLSYFESFPRNYIIPVRRLIALWLAEGLVEYAKHDLSYIGIDYLNQLIDKGFVKVTKSEIDGRPKMCSLARDNDDDSSSSTTANDQPSTMITYSTTGTGRRLFVRHTKDLQPSPENQYLESYKFLTSFMCFDYRKSFKPSTQISDFFRRGIDEDYFLSMKVLDLEGVYKPLLPKEMGRLKNLEYLGLRWTYIDTLPSFIGNLIKLRTIDVKHTHINTFPTWIRNLKNLQHLYMSEHHRGKFEYKPGSLQNIESLWGIFINDESDAKDRLYKLTKIKKLGLAYCDRPHEGVGVWISQLLELQSLKLKSKDRNGKPSTIWLKPFFLQRNLSKMYLYGELTGVLRNNKDDFPPFLTKLTLSASKLQEDSMVILGGLPRLVILRLYADSYIGTCMSFTYSSFPQLKVLKLWKLEQLEIWILQRGSLPILEELEIRSCKRLSMLPRELQHITTFKELKLTDMPKEFAENAKQDNDWSEKVRLCFTDWDVSKSTTGAVAALSTPSSSSVLAAPGSSSASSSSSSLASLVLLHLLAKRGAMRRTTTVPKGLPPL